MTLQIQQISAFILDFDGVLTNNKVLVDEHSKEYVLCNRSDGLAFDALRALKVQSFLVSTDKNSLVKARAKKLKVEAFNNIAEKSKFIKRLADERNLDLDKIFYVGNDLNDFKAMKLCNYSACPSDSHDRIKNIATYNLKCMGGDGVLREILEEIFNLDLVEILYS